jgi:hypothetical protein
MANNGQDRGLTAAVESGRLQFAAVDTDWKASRDGAAVPDYIHRRSSPLDASEPEAFRLLPRLPRLVIIQTEDITRAVEAIRLRRRGAAWMTGGGHREGPPLAARLSGTDVEDSMGWFPQDDEIGIGQARNEGAGQWRPLGRLGLFLEARAIMDELREGHKRVRDVTAHDRPVRIHILASLSGGTGSGLFWDIAFMLRIIDPNCTITGSFLMAEAFVGSDRAERIELNAYAALKELAGFKNWRQKEAFEVRYPIGPQGLVFRREPGARSVFDLVYVYQSFPPEGDSAGVDDVHAAAVQTSCYRLAQNVLTQLRVDVRSRIDEGANNERSDSNAPASQPEGAWVFSTTAMMPLDLLGVDYLADILEAQHLLSLKDRLTGSNMPVVSRQRLIEILRQKVWLEGADAAGQAAAATADARRPKSPRPSTVPGPVPSGAVPAQQMVIAELAGAWSGAVSSLEDQTKAMNVQGLPKTIEEYRKALKELENKAALLADPELNGKEEERAKRAIEMYNKYVPRTLREGWEEQIKKNKWNPDDNRPPIAMMPLVEILKLDIENIWKRVENWFDTVEELLKNDMSVLEDAAKRQIRTIIGGLDALGEEERLHEAAVEAPASLIQMRVVLGLRRDTDSGDRYEGRLRELYDLHGCGPIETMMAVFARRLHDALGAVSGNSAVQEGLGQAFRAYRSRHRAIIKDRFEAIIELSDRNHETRRQRTREIQARGLGQLRTVFSDDGGGHADEFAKAMRPLPGMLRQLSESPAQDAKTVVAKRLSERCLLVARSEGTQSESLFARAINAVDIWEKLLSKLDDGYREIENGQDRTAASFASDLAGAIEASVCPGLTREILASPDSFKERMAHARISMRAFVQFWSEQEDFILQRLGGESGLQNAMTRCRSRVFGKGTVVSSIQQDKLVIAKPVSVGPIDSRVMARNDGLRQAISRAAQNALNQTPMFCDDSSGPFVYFEQLFRAGAEILDVERYYRRYMSLPQEHRAGYHIVPAAVALPELLDEAAHSYSAAPSRPPVWTCPDHPDVVLPDSEALCPRCHDEYRQGRRPLAAVQSHDHGNAAIECPGCATLELPKEQRQHIPPSLRPYFKNGVRAEEQGQFERLLEQYGLGIACPRRSKKGSHMMFPAIMPVAGDRKYVLLYRDGDRFVSARDGGHFDHSCFHCGFPIAPWHVEAIRDGRVAPCPRCRRDLRECLYCSHRDGALFAPMGGHAGPQRCPRCTNIIHRHMADVDPAAVEGLDTPGFCRNLFGCPAGASPWSTAAEMADDGVCECCRDRQHPAVLLPYGELLERVRRCPACLTLIGIPSDGRVNRMNAAGLAVHFTGFDDAEPDRPCVLCGTQPAAVLRWMLDTGYFDDADPSVSPGMLDQLRDRVPGHYTLPGIDAADGMDLMEALWRHANDRHLYEAVRSLPGIVTPRRPFSALEREMRRLFVGKSVAPSVANERLRRLAAIQDDILARFDGRPVLELSVP